MREARSRSWKCRIAAGAAKQSGKNELTSGGTLPGQTAVNLTPTNASITCVRLPDSLSAKVGFRMADDSEVDGDMPVNQDLP
jgi:hypothetical protein